MSESYGKDDRYRPFSNGTEFEMWLGSNCQRGERGCRRYKPDATSSKDGCPIEVAVAIGSIDDGMIPMRIALRGGWVEPGPDGRLVRVTATDSSGLPVGVIPACPEFKGYDEPDDRPRRVPKPPADQLDIFDPRNVPDRQRVPT